MDALLALIPFAFILLCPLLMFFMMRGMHGGRGQADHAAHESTADRDELAHLREEVAALRDQVGTKR